MTPHDFDFEPHRDHLRGVAYRMLGSLAEADDAVQEAWLRLHRADPRDVGNPRGWLTTVVARICLDMLRARKARREQPLDPPGEPGDASLAAEAAAAVANAGAQEAELADAVGLALLVVLDTLSPAERLVFVLHDLFAVPFDDLATLVGRTPAATRQLASRARRRVRGAPTASDAELARQRGVAEAFLAAARAGDFDGLLAVLDPDVRVRGEAGPGQPMRERRGAEAWARGALRFSQRHVRPAVVDGTIGLVLAPGGHLQRALKLTIVGDRITEIEVCASPERLGQLILGALPDATWPAVDTTDHGA